MFGVGVASVCIRFLHKPDNAGVGLEKNTQRRLCDFAKNCEHIPDAVHCERFSASFH